MMVKLGFLCRKWGHRERIVSALALEIVWDSRKDG